MIELEKIKYTDLNARQKENFNFQKVAAHLADYGFNCLRLSDDWQGADFIACHINGNTFLKVQLKSRLNVDKKYCGKDIYITFCADEQWYFYPHDEVLAAILEIGMINESKSWLKKHGYSWPRLSGALKKLMKKYELGTSPGARTAD